MSSGRPRTEGLDAVIHHATLTLLAEAGYAGVSMAEVARMTNIAITTVYRRYANVQALIIGALRAEFAIIATDLPDTGSLVTDLAAYVTQVVSQLDPTRAAVLAALLLPMRTDPNLAEIVRQELARLGRGQWQVLVQRAVARGDLPPETHAADVLSLVVPSVIFQFVMVLGIDPSSTGMRDELVQFVLLPALTRQLSSAPGRTDAPREPTS